MTTPENLQTSQIDFSKIKGFLFDLDGVFYHGEKALPYGPEIIKLLQQTRRKYVAVTNNSTHSHQFFSARLQSMGVPFTESQIINSNDAVAKILSHTTEGYYAIGSDALKIRLKDEGIANCDTPKNVVVGWDDSVTIKHLKEGTRHLLNGAKLIGTNPDPLIPTPTGPEPENGALIAFLERAANCTAIIAGKPETPLFELGVEHLGLKRDEIVMVGDTLETDIAGANKSGLQTVLLTSGSEVSQDSDIQATIVMSGLKELYQAILKSDEIK